MSAPTPSENTILDPYFLGLSFLVTFAIQMVFFFAASALKMDKVTDFAYGLGFVVLGVLLLVLGGTFHTRQILLCILTCLWGVRLAGYLLFRILKIGHDARFDGVREVFWRFLIFWVFQAVVVFITYMPLTFCLAQKVDSPYSWRDSLGYAMFVVGLIIETIADQQKFAYRNDAANKGHWCDVGLWKWSRHPNYTGELLCWWGLFSVSSAVFHLHPWQFVSIIGPLLLTMSILFFSGITRLERMADERYWFQPDYQQYRKQTSPLWLIPPAIYGALPVIVKRVLLLELPAYENPQEEKNDDGPLSSAGDKQSVSCDEKTTLLPDSV
eukprot:TRINITY_DN172_c0_g1_i3.p1 TRINITY_DN172_c0_g1~~TRINITY_DN172_c0_g1_i3.p1  ORF type:complete len:339 (-),score=42.23 TRINITY_DN172_c0_g1_i3:162-1139(-)